MTHTRGARYHPQTQGKIERYHRSIKNVFNLQNYYLPGELEQDIERFVEHYNIHRYHESLDNLTPADVYFGRKRERLSVREMIKRETMKLRRTYNLRNGGKKKHLLLMKSTPNFSSKCPKCSGYVQFFEHFDLLMNLLWESRFR